MFRLLKEEVSHRIDREKTRHQIDRDSLCHQVDLDSHFQVKRSQIRARQALRKWHIVVLMDSKNGIRQVWCKAVSTAVNELLNKKLI